MRHRKIDVIFIDHLHEILPDNTRVTRVEQLGDTVSNIIKMARDLSVPVVLLAQLNRGIDSRLNKRPLASDLKGSGAIEEKADVILAIHREEDVDAKRMSNDTELMFLKNRHGPEGVTEKLIFRPNEMRFEKEGPMLEHF
jgi:replicative DNA helicase